MQNIAKKKQITLTQGSGKELRIVEWYVSFLIIIPQGLI